MDIICCPRGEESAMWYQLYSWWVVLNLIEVPSCTCGELCSILIELLSYTRGELCSIWSQFPVILMVSCAWFWSRFPIILMVSCAQFWSRFPVIRVVSCARFDRDSKLYSWWAVKCEVDKTNGTHVLLTTALMSFNWRCSIAGNLTAELRCPKL